MVFGSYPIAFCVFHEWRGFLRHCSGSLQSCCTYLATVQKYSAWLGYSPDLIIQDVKPIGNIPDPARVQNHSGYLNDYLAELQDEGLKPGSANNCIKGVKTFYRANGVKIELTEPLSRRVTYKDRAPKPEELAKLFLQWVYFQALWFGVTCFLKVQERFGPQVSQVLGLERGLILFSMVLDYFVNLFIS